MTYILIIAEYITHKSGSYHVTALRLPAYYNRTKRDYLLLLTARLFIFIYFYYYSLYTYLFNSAKKT